MGNDVNELKQRLKIRKYLIFVGVFLLFLGAVWLIFIPSEEEKRREEKNVEFNTELSDLRGAGIEGDKITTYEQADMKRKRTEKLCALKGFSEMADGNPRTVVELSPDVDTKDGSSREGNRRNKACSSFVSTYNDVNRTLGDSYELPQENPEREVLGARVEQLKQAVATQNVQPGYGKQVALLEKSYGLVTRYIPGSGSMNTDSRSDNESPGRNGKAKAVPVGLVSTPVVSSLSQPVSDSMQPTGMTQSERFHTPVGNKEERSVRSTTRVCIHGDQTVISGQGARMRLLKPTHVGKHILPKNSLLIGEGCIQSERPHVSILQVEYGSIIIPVGLAVCDNDGQGDIFIPRLMEVNAVKEVVASLGQSLGTSISITNQSVGDQPLSEPGKGAVQSVSQYIPWKMREEKVHLKSGYTLMLYQDNDQ